MGPMWPISGRGDFPLGPCALGEALPPLLGRRPLPPCGFSTIWEGEGGVHPSLGGVPFFPQSNLISICDNSLSLSPSFVGLPLFGVCTRLGFSPPYAHRRAAGIGIRIHLLPLLSLFGARGNVAYIVRV